MSYISVEDLKVAFDLITKRMEKEGLQQVEFETDLYNVIHVEDWDITNSAEDVVVTGSLVDDIKEIKSLIYGKDRFCTTVDFDRFANILRAVGAVIAR